MGNAQFTSNEANAQLPIDKSFLQKCQKHVTTVDHAITGLAKGIDALQSTCRLFLQQYSTSTDGQVKDMSVSTSAEAVIPIIQKINECISDNKEVTIESVKNFFSFIKETGKDRIENVEEAFASLSVNTYQSLLTENKDDWYTDFYKKRNKLLQKEIEMLRNDSRIQKELMETLKKQQACILDKEELKLQIKDWIEQNSHKDERLEGSSSESKCDVALKSTTEQPQTYNSQTQISTVEPAVQTNQIIRHENLALKKESTECPSMYANIIDELRKQVKILEEDKSKMQTQLNERSLNTKTFKKVIVQVFSRYFTSSPKEPEEDLLVLLGTELSKRDIELKVLRCIRPSQVVSGCPLLVTIDHSYYNSRRKNTTIESAMASLEFTQDKAVIVFHFTPEKDLPNKLKLYDKKYTSLGGVIHFGHNPSLYTSTLNTNSIKEVIAFIEKLGKVVIESSF